MQVNFRYSDTDFIAYLMTLNYEYNDIEVVRDELGRLKAFVHFNGEKDTLIDLYDKYMNGRVKCNIMEFSQNRRKIVKLIKSEILQYQASNI